MASGYKLFLKLYVILVEYPFNYFNLPLTLGNTAVRAKITYKFSHA